MQCIIDILGTEYKIRKAKISEDEFMKENSFNG